MANGRPDVRATPVRIERNPFCTVCALSGELDAAAARAVREAFRQVSAEGRVLVDLCGASFVDSAGLGALVGGIRLLRAEGTSVAIVCDVPAVRRVLQMTGFHRIVEVAPTRAEAAAAMARARGEPGEAPVDSG